MNPTVTVTAMTGRGLRRTGNEDRVGVFGWLAPTDMAVPVTLRTKVFEPVVVTVADGLGGHLAGEVASTRAVEAFQADPARLTDGPAIAQRLRNIHADLLAAGTDRADWAGMATTLVAVVVCKDTVLVTGVGDSRIYYVEPGLVEQLTEDDAAENGALNQVLGGRPGETIDPQVVTNGVWDGLRLLLCTDGLHSYLDETELRKWLHDPDPATAAAALNDAVHAAGAPDNVSLCIVDIESES